jgi:SAM-dependent methyltransferase
VVASLACPLCRGPLEAHDCAARCPRCGDFARVSGVAVLVAQPALAIREMKDRAIRSWVDIEVTAAKARAATCAEGSDKAAIERALAGLRGNQELFERIALPAHSHARAASPDPLALAPLFARDADAWPFAELLPYFYFDWFAARDPVRDLFVAEAKRHAPAGGAALVVGCGASGVVRDLEGAWGPAFGLDLSLPSLLLARKLLDGEDVRVHVASASWKGFTLRGASPPARATLVCGDAAALPFADESFAVVVTQYLLDIVADPAAVLREVNRVLAPGGVWLHDGLPFRFRGVPAVVPPYNGDSWATVMDRFGFDVIEVARRAHTHLDQRATDPWALFVQHQVVHASMRKREALSPAREASAFAAYFAGDPTPLFSLAPKLVHRDKLLVLRRVGAGGVEIDPAIRVGGLEVSPKNETRLASALAFLCALDGETPTERVIEAMSAIGTPGERDTTLALEALYRTGLVELVG